MNYTISKTNIDLRCIDKEFIDTKISLNLSRYNSMITKLQLSFMQDPNDDKLTLCIASIKFNKTIALEISDSGASIQSACTLVVGRIKRNIERNIKRHKQSGLSFANRMRP